MQHFDVRKTANFVYKAEPHSFVGFLQIAGLDPAVHLQNANLIGADFSCEDLSGFDFTGANIEGCWFWNSLVLDATFDADQLQNPALRYAADWPALRDRMGLPPSLDVWLEPEPFRYSTQSPAFGIAIRQLDIRADESWRPLVTAASLRFRPGEWTLLQGRPRTGTAAILGAIGGVWRHGGGEVALPEGATNFRNSPLAKLPTSATLKELVCMPRSALDFRDVEVAAALHKAGLGILIEYLDARERDGEPWHKCLGAFDRQKLVLARILLKQPNVILLEEPTRGMDTVATVAFFEALKQLPEAIVIIAGLYADRPRRATGEEFFDSIGTIKRGVLDKRGVVDVQPLHVSRGKDMPSMRPIRTLRRPRLPKFDHDDGLPPFATDETDRPKTTRHTPAHSVHIIPHSEHKLNSYDDIVRRLAEIERTLEPTSLDCGIQLEALASAAQTLEYHSLEVRLLNQATLAFNAALGENHPLTARMRERAARQSQIGGLMVRTIKSFTRRRPRN